MIDEDLVLTGCSLDILQAVLDLARENVDALDFDHVVGPAEDDVDPGQRSAAGAGDVVGDDPGQIVGPVADQRRAFFLEGGDDQLAQFSVRQVLAGMAK